MPRRSPPRRRSAASAAPRRRTSVPWPCCRSPARDWPRRRAARTCAAGRSTLRPARPLRRARQAALRHGLGRHVVGRRWLRRGRRRRADGGGGAVAAAAVASASRWVARRLAAWAATARVAETAAPAPERAPRRWSSTDRCCGSRSRTRRRRGPRPGCRGPPCARCSAAAARCSMLSSMPIVVSPAAMSESSREHPAALRAAPRSSAAREHVVVLEVGRRVTARARAHPLRRLGLRSVAPPARTPARSA